MMAAPGASANANKLRACMNGKLIEDKDNRSSYS
jgi:hypothetical protein